MDNCLLPSRRVGSRVSLALVVMLLAVTLPARAQTMAPAAPQATAMLTTEQRLERVEHVLDSGTLLGLSQRLDQLEEQVRAQHGQLEEAQNQIEALRKQNRDLYADLDARLHTLEARTPATAPEGVPPVMNGAAGSPASNTSAPAAAATPADENSRYDHAIATLRSGKYLDAIAEFKAFEQAYPNGSLLDHALYWLGESYYVSGDFDHAAESFRAVMTRFPKSAKLADAHVKLGMSQMQQGHMTEARATFEAVSKLYPGSHAAATALQKLQSLPAR